MREKFSWLRKYGPRVLLLAIVMGCAGVWGWSNIAQAASCGTNTTLSSGIVIANFICPKGIAPYSGNSFDDPADIGLDSPQGGGGSTFNATLAAPGSRITLNLRYTPAHNGSSVFAWIQTPVSTSVLDGTTGSSQDGPGAFSPNVYDYTNNGGGSDFGCPAFWMGRQSPYQNEGNATASGNVLGDYETIGTAIDGHTGCGNSTLTRGSAGIWGPGAGSTAGTPYRYTTIFDIKEDAPSASNTLYFSGRVSSGNIAPNPIANMKARTASLYFKIEDMRLDIKMRASDGTSVTVAPRINQDCSGAGSRPGAQILAFDSLGNYGPSIAKGSKYCLYAPPSYVSGSRTYTLAANVRNNQIAGAHCNGQTRPSALRWNCVGSAVGGDLAGDSHTFFYTTSGGSVEIGGRVYDAFNNEGLGGATIVMGSACNTATDVSVAPSGDYRFTIVKYAKFCLDPVDAFVADNGFTYTNPNPANYGLTDANKQVAGADCRSYPEVDTGAADDLGRGCTGWLTAGQDNSHLGAERIDGTYDSYCAGDADEGYGVGGDYVANRSCNQFSDIRGTYDGKCAGGADEGYDAGGDYPDWQSCNQFQNPETLRATYDGKCAGGADEGYDAGGEYSETERCNQFQNPETLKGTYDGKCAGGADEGYDAGGDYPETERCNQFVNAAGNDRHSVYEMPWRHSVYDKPWRHTVRHFRHTVRTTPYLPYVNDKPCDICYDFGYTGSAVISGRVYNVTDGGGYASAPIETCAAGVVNTDVNGYYSFSVNRGTNFCARDPLYQRDPRTPGGGVQLEGPDLNTAYTTTGSCITTVTYECQVADLETEPNYDFAYRYPSLIGSNMTKTVDVGAGANVAPGQPLEYTITVYNSGSTISNVAIEDFIPQNIDPATVSVNGVTVDGVSQPCTGIIINGLFSCGSFSSGYNQPVYDCGACISPSTPPSIIVYQPVFPAQSVVIIKWVGKVRSASGTSGVGVFPKDYRYCDISTDWATRGDVTTHSDDATSCEDFGPTTGLQAVVNYSRVSYHWTPGSTYAANFSGWGLTSTGAADPRGGGVSPLVENRIPGNVSCMVKWSTAQEDLTTGQTTRCTPPQTYANGYVYSTQTTEPKYNLANINLRIDPDTNGGPFEYHVVDQRGPTPAGTPLAGPLQDPTSSSPTVYSTAPTALYDYDLSKILTWGKANKSRYPSRWFNSYDFGVQFKDAGIPLGGTFTNQAMVCLIEHWIPGHATRCIDSNQISFQRVQVDRPYLTSRQGGVHAGNGPAGSCAFDPYNTSNQNIVNGQGASGSTGKGWYVVSSTGTVSYFPSIVGQQQPSSNYVCRPDLEDSARKYAAKGGSYRHDLSGPNATNYGFPVGGPSQSGFKGKVVRANSGGTGDFTLNATQVTERWTLFVDGDLTITGNIVNNAVISSLGTSGSLGIIATGNIYIAPGVTQVSAYLYAKGSINTCAVKDATYFGGVKTLAYSVGGNPSPNPGFSTAECGAKLNVDGLMMANSFRYNRVVNPNAAVDNYSEIGRFSNRLFLATPPAFSDLAVSLNSLYGGEARPRY